MRFVTFLLCSAAVRSAAAADAALAPPRGDPLAAEGLVDAASGTTPHANDLHERTDVRASGVTPQAARDATLNAAAAAAAAATAVMPAPGARGAQACSSAQSCCNSTAVPITCAGCCSGTTTIDLGGKNIGPSLPANLFANLPALTTIYLNNNALQYLPAELFANNAALSQLQLQYNQLVGWGLPVSIFANLRDLYSLRLYGNPLVILPTGFITAAANPGLLNIILDGNDLATDLPSNCKRYFFSISGIPSSCFGEFSPSPSASVSQSLSASPTTGLSVTPSVTASMTTSQSVTASRMASPSVTASTMASPSPTASPSTTNADLIFRSLPRTDLVGTLVGGAGFFTTASEGACRIACLASPSCDAYAFSAGVQAAFDVAGETVPCFLLANVTALVPNNMMSSGVLSARYS